MLVQIQLLREAARSLKNLDKEMPDRVRAARTFFVEEVAKRVHKEIVSRIPKRNADQLAYRNALRLARIEDSEEPGVAIVASADKDLTTVDASQTLFFFPQGLDSRLDAAAAILGAWEPWTLDQLPQVEVTSAVKLRVASEPEIEQTRARNAEERAYVIMKLEEAGVTLGERFTMRGKAQVDLENYALRMEFGTLGTPHYPHWRPSLGLVATGQLVREMKRDPRVVRFMERTLNDVTFDDWARRRSDIDASVTVKEMVSMRRFMEKVAPDAF